MSNQEKAFGFEDSNALALEACEIVKNGLDNVESNRAVACILQVAANMVFMTMHELGYTKEQAMSRLDILIDLLNPNALHNKLI